MKEYATTLPPPPPPPPHLPQTDVPRLPPRPRPRRWRPCVAPMTQKTAAARAGAKGGGSHLQVSICRAAGPPLPRPPSLPALGKSGGESCCGSGGAAAGMVRAALGECLTAAGWCGGAGCDSSGIMWIDSPPPPLLLCGVSILSSSLLHIILSKERERESDRMPRGLNDGRVQQSSLNESHLGLAAPTPSHTLAAYHHCRPAPLLPHAVAPPHPCQPAPLSPP